MPPKRVSSTKSAPARRSNQSAGQHKLIFGGKDLNRVTKSNTSPRSSKVKKSLDDDINKNEETIQISPPAADDPLSNPLPSTSKTEEVLGGRVIDPEEEIEDEEEEDPAFNLARTIPLSRIKTYWRNKESARLAPRIHQQDLSLGEKILREFDMSGHFGPCIGIGRTQRWIRAQRLGLEPPVEVLGVLLGRLDQHEDDEMEGKKKNGSKSTITGAKDGVVDRAYVDVLMGNGVAIVA